MATIKQIAELAGVSRGTVDRVLHNRGTVNPETAARILELAQNLHYSPNKAGKTLAVKRKNICVGYIIFGNSVNPFWEEVARGAERKAQELEEYGVRVDMRYTPFGDWEKQLTKIDELVKSGVNGLAIAPVNHPRIAARLREITAAGIPVVTVNTDIEDSNRVAYVGSNYVQGGRIAAGLMRIATNGKAKIAVVIGGKSLLCHTERLKGFQEVLVETCPDSKIVGVIENNDDDFESYMEVEKYLKKNPQTTALYLCAAGVYGACRAVEQLGLQDKLKIICYDAVPTTIAMMRKGLITASICQQPLLQGSVPLDILFNLIAMGVPPKRDTIYMENQIIVAESLKD